MEFHEKQTFSVRLNFEITSANPLEFCHFIEDLIYEAQNYQFSVKTGKGGELLFEDVKDLDNFKLFNKWMSTNNAIDILMKKNIEEIPKIPQEIPVARAESIEPPISKQTNPISPIAPPNSNHILGPVFNVLGSAPTPLIPISNVLIAKPPNPMKEETAGNQNLNFGSPRPLLSQKLELTPPKINLGIVIDKQSSTGILESETNPVKRYLFNTSANPIDLNLGDQVEYIVADESNAIVSKKTPVSFLSPALFGDVTQCPNDSNEYGEIFASDNSKYKFHRSQFPGPSKIGDFCRFNVLQAFEKLAVNIAKQERKNWSIGFISSFIPEKELGFILIGKDKKVGFRESNLNFNNAKVGDEVQFQTIVKNGKEVASNIYSTGRSLCTGPHEGYLAKRTLPDSRGLVVHSSGLYDVEEYPDCEPGDEIKFEVLKVGEYDRAVNIVKKKDGVFSNGVVISKPRGKGSFGFIECGKEKIGFHLIHCPPNLMKGDQVKFAKVEMNGRFQAIAILKK